MRKALGIVFYALAGFFVYAVCLLSFMNEEHTMVKWLIIAVFSLPAVAFLFIGLSLNRYLKWRRDVGVVLLCGTGAAAFAILVLGCLLMTDEFRKMMKPDTLRVFNAYVTGSIFTLILVGLGIFGIRAEKHTPSV